MRVALDAGPTLRSRTGVGRYARELASHLEARGVSVARYAVALRGPSDGAFRRWRLPARLVYPLWMRTGRPSAAALIADADVVHGTNFVLPPLDGRPGVVTVHDLSFYSDEAKPVAYLRDVVPWTIARARRVIVPSHAIASEVTGRFRLPAERIDVIYEGVSEVFFRATPLADSALARLGIAAPFVLAVGTVQPRKNLPRLLEAWAAARDSVAEWTLVIAGPKGWGPDLRATAGVRLIGYVGDETLPGLAAAADVFCYPSLYEGFGLPPLEAMAARTPAIVSRYSAAEEVVGDAAVLVDPYDVEAIANGIRTLVSDDALRARLARVGRAHAASFSWERTARATLDAYRRALEA